jgi:uncharacterized protein YjbI with pentapeptide repeats
MAKLGGANLSGADLSGADLTQAELHTALNLTCAQLVQAKNWEAAYRELKLACGKPIPKPPVKKK